MARLLLNLRNVPDDEHVEVRELLDAHDIDYYETAPNRWGISMGAIWVRDDSQISEAQSLVADYQQRRQQRMRDAYESDRAHGRAETLWQRLRRRPLQSLLYIGVAALVLYLSTKPFLDLAGD